MKRRQALGRAFALLVLVAVPTSMLLVVMQIRGEFEENRALRASVEQSTDARQDLLKLLSDLQEVEAGQRGYVVSRDPRFLAPFVEARARIAQRFAQDGPAGRSAPELDRIEDLSRRKIAFAEQTIDLVAKGRIEAARMLIADGEGKRLMDIIRTDIQRLDHAEEARLAVLADARDRNRERAERLINGALASLAALLVVLSFTIWRMLHLRQAALDRVRGLSARNRAIFDGAVDGMVVLDDEGYIREANPSMTRLFGFANSELIGMHNTSLMASPPPLDESIAWLRHVGSAGAEGSGQQQEFIGRRADRSTLAADVSISRVGDGDEVTFVAVIRDVTERKRIEGMKTEFVSTVSHELRTPLTSIGGSLGLLAAGAAGPLEEKVARLVSIAHSNCERLIRLINDILDIEKIESGKMQFDLRRMSLAPLLQRTAQANRAFGDAHAVAIELSMPPWPVAVMGDPDRLEQLLTNLVSNAVKHSPAGETVHIALETAGGRARIEVRDRGDGIPEDFRDRIFGKFAMADGSDSRRRGGTGLGLAIAREIAVSHAGSLGFADREGGGTVFAVELPLAECEDVCNADKPDTGLPLLLHLDDDADCLAVVASAFSGKASVISVSSLADARQEIGGRDLSGVIVDVVVPPDNGLDLIPGLRASAPDLPIIVFTALDDIGKADDVDAVLIKSRNAVETLVETTMALVARADRKAA
ncbi:ATP-binding protein [Tsuneonella sp. YG55]|uniref:histidine kinase n=1 Tax=Tsuneonella litorea TaxID=2976475 RepID=A0A9X2W0F3_9SPHN|nr:ATP-binding protein [Tsuneonella litorea]MCT2558427.1 ATP-binding protein [Tsuneonella litorea]